LSVQADPLVPTVKAAQPLSWIPLVTAALAGIVIVQIVVSAASAGDAATTLEETKRGDRSTPSALIWIPSAGIEQAS
jgi:hypothetical protein